MNISFVYFGTSLFSVIVLDELKARGFIPRLIVTTPDKPQGKKMLMTPSPVKVWAERENIPFIQPKTLKREEAVVALKSHGDFDVFIVASYGKIIPKTILDLPKHNVLNVHPSLLPKFRGASPIQSAIVADAQETGVSIMRLDEEMDHGPLLAQEKITIPNWPVTTHELKKILGDAGGRMLADLLPDWIAGKIPEKEQDHTQATYTTKIQKTDGLLDLAGDPYTNYLKIKAFHDWPKPYFFIEKNGKQLRVIVSEAHYENNTLTIERVIPEGKQEMIYVDFKKGYLGLSA
jgi:methionyl-tRNA formyltransferase